MDNKKIKIISNIAEDIKSTENINKNISQEINIIYSQIIERILDEDKELTAVNKVEILDLIIDKIKKDYPM